MDSSHTAHDVHLFLGLCKALVKFGRGKDALESCTDALEINEELVEVLVPKEETKLLTEDWEGAVSDPKIAFQTLMRAERSLKLSKHKGWYKVLGVSKTSSIAEIKRACKKLALQWHPDKNTD